LPGRCGVALYGYSLTWSGGLTAVHRDVALVEAEAAGPGGVTMPPDDVDVVVAPKEVRLPEGWAVRWTGPTLMVAQRATGCT
jgi:Flp pilus assembly protein CpaB